MYYICDHNVKLLTPVTRYKNIMTTRMPITLWQWHCKSNTVVSALCALLHHEDCD